MKLSEQDIKIWIKSYNETKKLPSIKVPCTECDVQTTLCHDNLHNRVERFGGIENLLNTFKCRACCKSSQPKKEIVKREPRKQEKKESVNNIENVRIFHIPKPPTIVHLLDDPEEAAKLTYDQCMRPDLFLDNNRSCDDCSLLNVCACSIKTLSKNGRGSSRVLVRRR